MEEASASTPDRGGVFDRLLPLEPWLGSDATRGIEQGQVKTRLVCAFIGLCGLILIGRFVELPRGIVAIAIGFPLYAIGYAIHVRVHPAPTRARRAAAVLVDNMAVSFIASYGGAFAAYVAFYFLATVGWGLRFGRHYLFATTAVAIAGMLCNLFVSLYWRQNEIFGAVLIIAMLANTMNVAVLLRRIAVANRRLAEKMEEISRLAWQDPLTRLPNRLYFRERLSQTLASAARSGRRVALLLFDIDGFKQVNDTLGHEAGDRLLQEIGRRVGGRIREADTFARLGGDEFVVIMDTMRDRSDAVVVAETIMKAVDDINMFGREELRVGASVGIACGDPDAAQSADELLNKADRAMYEAKRAGKGCYRFADEVDAAGR